MTKTLRCSGTKKITFLAKKLLLVLIYFKILLQNGIRKYTIAGTRIRVKTKVLSKMGKWFKYSPKNNNMAVIAG
ncbi:hypothetical protein [Ulvibacterium sp.]|uniref:hypothetical protein n=1 Tax=Ulvibacterium sp. TaxID=2665914 RepID=UPI003BA971C3